MKYLSTHANLCDIHTKPLGPVRLQCLLFLHDYMDDCDRCIGENEWNQAHASAMMKARLRHVKQVTGSSGPRVDVEATSGATMYRNSFVPLFTIFMIMVASFASVAARRAARSRNGDTDGWLFISAPGGQVYRRGWVYFTAAILAGFFAWSLGPTTEHGLDVGVYHDTTTTTSMTSSMQYPTDYIYFAALVLLLTITSVMSILLVRARRLNVRQKVELTELRELCTALWDEQRDDKTRIRELKQECFELSRV